jgi:hypothetical protein
MIEESSNTPRILARRPFFETPSFPFPRDKSHAPTTGRAVTLLFEDTFTTNEVLKGGYEFRFVPSVTMDNHESTNLAGCVRFLSRQLLNCRLYHRAWPKILLLALLTTLPIPINLALPVVAAWLGEWALVGWSVVAWAAFGLGIGFFNSRVESQIRQRLDERGIHSAQFSLHAVWVAPLTLVVYAVALWNCIRQREVNWRGIRYQFQSGTDVRRLNYEPFVAESSAESTSIL